MDNFFSMDNPFFKGVENIANIVYVSVLWLIFSIPIFTVGASTTALYYTVTKVIRHNRGYIFREFWSSFKANFKQSTIIWLLYVLLLSILVIDIRIMVNFDSSLSGILRYTFAITMVIATVILIFSLAYTARFEQDIKHIIGNSVLMGLKHLPKTLLIAVVTGGAILAIYFMGFAFFFVPAIAAVIDSVILESIFVQYMSEEDKEKENLRNHPEQYEYVNRKP